MLRSLSARHFLLSTGIFFIVSAQIFPGSTVPSAREIEKKMVKVKDSLYACRYETGNGDYRNFLTSLRQADPQSYERYLVDSAGWNDVFGYQQPLVMHYFRHPGFANYPVVNVSYEGAVAYCNWLTEVYNNDRKRKFSQVRFHLPDTSQWMEAARGGKGNWRYPWGDFSLISKEGMYLCNHRHFSEEYIVSDNAGNPVINRAEWNSNLSGVSNRYFYTTEIKSFFPNSIGIYNMSGNAAEMTIEKGIAKGGSWNSFGGEVTIAAVKRYKESGPEVGFRIFMTVVRP